jgi:hypothetical protein
MGDSAILRQGDAPQPQPVSPLLEDSGFLSGLKHAGHSAGQLFNKGVKEGQDLLHSPTAKKIGGQIADTSHQIITSPTTGKIVSEVKQTGVQVAHENVDHVNGAIRAGKAGDLQGVVKNVAPLAEEAALGPTGLALKIGKDKLTDAAVSHAPASDREALKQLAQGGRILPHLTIVGAGTSLAKAELLKEPHPHKDGNDAKSAGSPPPADDSSAHTSSFLSRLREKLQLGKTANDTQTEQK